MNCFFGCAKRDHKVNDYPFQDSKGKNGKKTQPSDFGLGSPCVISFILFIFDRITRDL